MTKSKTSVKSFLKNVGVFACAYLLYKVILLIFATMSSPRAIHSTNNAKMSEGMFTVQLMKAADSMNKLMPIHLDSLTEYTNVQSLPNKVFEISVKINIDSSRYDMVRFKKVLDTAWFNDIIMSENLKDFRDNNIIIIYKFFDRKNHSLFTLNYSPDTYNK